MAIDIYNGTGRTRLLLITLLLLPPEGITSTPCIGPICYCRLDFDEWKVTCAISMEKDVVLDYNPEASTISIDCGGNPNPDFPIIFANFKLSNQTRSVSLIACPMPDIPFVDHLSFTNFTELYFSMPPGRPLGNVTPEIFEGLDGLKKLGLGHNELLRIPRNLFSNMLNLTYIDLSGNQLDSLPEGLFNSSRYLTTINLASNHLRVLAEPLGQLPELQKLYLHANQLVNITRPAFSGMSSLKFLDLQGNYLDELQPDVFHDLVHLQQLRLFSNRITKLPETLLQNNLVIELLYLQDNLIQELPDDLIANHTNLREVNIAGCNLSSLPPSFFGGLPNLTVLDLSSNHLKTLDGDTFSGIPRLRELSLQSNYLVELPGDLFSLNLQLTHLLLSRNRIETIGQKIFGYASNLTKLDLSYNKLSKLIDPFNGVTGLQLQTLNLCCNNLTLVDREAFLSCGRLQNLDLSRNQLESTDFQLPQGLVDLNLSNNKIKEISVTMQQWFPKLNKIDLSYNDIQQLSVTSFQFPPSAEVDFQHNNISKVDLYLEDIVFGADRVVSQTPLARLSFNPIRCDCNIKYLLSHMRHQQQEQLITFRLNIFNLTCSHPPELVGRYVNSLSEADLYCRIYKDCPEPCHCLLQAEGTVTRVHCPPLNGTTLKQIPAFAPTNTTVLDMTGNDIWSLRGLDTNSWANLNTLILTNNNLTTLEVDLLPKSLKTLRIDGNNLQRLSSSTMDGLSVRSNLSLWLGHNPWYCSCEDELEPWLDSTPNVMDAYDMDCANIADTNVRSFVCPEGNWSLLVGLVVAAVIIAAAISFAGIAYYKYLHEIRVWLYAHGWCMWFVTESDVDADKQFDAFISFSQEDIEFVEKELLPGLEQQEPYYQLCIHQRDWLVGEWIPDQIIRSVEISCRTIVLLSSNFLQSVWGRLEFKTAHHQALQDRMNRVIIIVLGDVPSKDEMDPEMRMYVGLNTYLHWSDPWFWKKLRYAMPHKPMSRSSKHMSNRNGELRTSSITSADSGIRMSPSLTSDGSDLMTPSSDKSDSAFFKFPQSQSSKSETSLL